MAFKNYLITIMTGVLLVSGENIIQSKTITEADTLFLKEGDLLFQDLDCGPMCDAIEEVTQGIGGAKFSHVGLVIVRNERIFVIEAVSKGVSITPVSDFLTRTFDKQGKPKVVVGRLKKEYQNLIKPAVNEALKYVGRPYDQFFNVQNDSLYCSELIYLAFRKANKDRPFFQLQPMTYKSPATGKTYEVWVQYFEKLGVHIPEGEPGINPGGISMSPYLDIYFHFGKPDGMKDRKMDKRRVARD